jgi:hypothetical protein
MSREFWRTLADHELTFPKRVEEQLALFRLSDGARAVLAHASRINQLKKSNSDVLSVTFILVGAVDLGGRNFATTSNITRDPEDTREYALLATLAQRLSKIAPGFAPLVSDLVEPDWAIGTLLPPLVKTIDVELSEAALAALEAVAREEPIDVGLLLRTILPKSTMLPTRIGSDNIAALVSLVTDISTFGSRPPYMTRESGVPADALRTEEYAIALATAFRTATDEFCLGIFGHWGIGKTYLARRVGELLTSSHDALLLRLRQTAGGLIDPTLETVFSRGYEVVTFSAWKYRRTPELWVYLYETLANACMSGQVPLKAGSMRWGALRSAAALSTRWSRLLRYNALRQGRWPLLLSLASLGVALSPISPVGTALYLLLLLLPLLGFGGLLWATRLFRTTRSGVQSILRRYTSIAKHTEKLGLQALLGDDLRSLIGAWVPLEAFRLSALWREALVFSGVLILWLVGLSGIIPTTCDDLAKTSPDSFSGLASVLCKNEPHYLRLVVQALVTLVLFGSVAWLLHWRGIAPTERILLVVDDLDRCGADEITEVMESLKLLLEDPEIKRRVQVMMLVDEGAIECAIAHKFAGLIKARAEACAAQDREQSTAPEAAHYEEAARYEVVQEHLEKLFLCHFRLPRLSPSEVFEVTEAYMREFGARKSSLSTNEAARKKGSGQEAEQARNGLEAGRDRPTPRSDTPGDTEKLSTESVTEWPEPLNAEPISTADAQLLFTDDEMREMTSILAEHAGADGRLISPRAIRAFMLKYQLARLLRQLAEQPVQPATLMKALATASFRRACSSAVPQQRERHAVDVIASQLA